jgi:hypothetical protein
MMVKASRIERGQDVAVDTQTYVVHSVYYQGQTVSMTLHNQRTWEFEVWEFALDEDVEVLT